jgi:PhnB protein
LGVNPIPEGYQRVTPYLVVDDAAALLDFVTQVFDAQQRGDRFKTPEGRIGHAEFTIGDSVVMCADASTSDQGQAIPGVLNVYVEDVDKAYARALEAGATSLREVADQFYGDRTGGVRDSNGNQWWIASHVEDVSPEEMAKRAAEAQGAASS